MPHDREIADTVERFKKAREVQEKLQSTTFMTIPVASIALEMRLYDLVLELNRIGSGLEEIRSRQP
ncbi:MAG: hypothetical protein KGI71_05750 [Patescibacteria group bacterium]|nr:hypothetical protein [Patescibacteria group bacterium]